MKQTTQQIIQDAFAHAIPQIVSQTRSEIKQDFVLFKEEILKEVDQKLEQQKKGIIQDVDKKLDEKLEKQTEKIYLVVAETIKDNFMPFLDKQDRRINRLERHTNHPPIPTQSI